MATFTVTASGFLSDLAIYSGSPGAAPVDADVLNIGAFTIYVDYSIAVSSLITNGGKLIPATGNVTMNITGATLTGHLLIQGSPRQSYPTGSGTVKAAQGIGGIG